MNSFNQTVRIQKFKGIGEIKVAGKGKTEEDWWSGSQEVAQDGGSNAAVQHSQ